MKTKVNFIGDFSDVSYEGFMSIVKKLKTNIKDFDIEFNSNKECKITNYHSAGFLDAMKNKKKDQIEIYSVHSNLTIWPHEEIRSVSEQIMHTDSFKETHFSKGKLLKNTIMRSISVSTPMFIKRHYIKKFDKIVVPSRYLSNKLNLPNTIIIRYGIDLNKFKPKKLKSKTKKTKVAYIGHMSPVKGILEATKAFALLDDKKFERTIFPSSSSTKFESYVKKKDSKIKVGDFIKDIAKEYNNQDILVFPFRNVLSSIASPLVLIEAMACGRPIITTDLPHIREIAGDSVIYVKPYKWKQLAKKIEKLSKDKELQKKLGVKARRQAEKFYDQKDMIKNYENLYKKMLLNKNN